MQFEQVKITDLKAGDAWLWYYGESDALASQLLQIMIPASIEYYSQQYYPHTKAEVPMVWRAIEPIKQLTARIKALEKKDTQIVTFIKDTP